MIKITIQFISNFSLSVLALLLTVSSLFAAPVVRQASGVFPDQISQTVKLFRQDLGGANNGTGNSYATGRREVNWEELSDNDCAVGGVQFNFYNTNVPRGMILSQNQGYNCSRNPNFGGQNEIARFGNINSDYPAYFNGYNGFRIFAPSKAPEFEIQFVVPGTNIPATVSGFGAVFLDKDVLENGMIFLYDAAGNLIDSRTPPAANNGFSFVGISYKDGTRIARVRVRTGSVALGPSESANSTLDVVALDDIIYGEPRAIGHQSSDFDGDGITDHAVYRPGSGSWYVLQSGSNTFYGVKFGDPNDIPLNADFDGDSRIDVAVYRPLAGAWIVLRSSDGQVQYVQFGAPTDKPVPADYDKDGRADFAVWRPGTGFYYILQSSNNQMKIVQWGASGDIVIGAAKP